MSFSFLSHVPYINPDPIFELTAEYNHDSHPFKVNLGQGTYRDGDGKPWVLNSVKRAKEVIKNSGHEYLPILGLRDFRKSCSRLLLGESSVVVSENRVASSQAVSGTGSLHMAALFLAKYYSMSQEVYISDPTWGNHAAVFENTGFNVRSYPYYDPCSGSLLFDKFLECLESAERGSIIVLHACAHNPTGLDPSKKQWQQIGTVMKDKHLFPIFDAAYLGFNSGSYSTDCWAIRFFFHELLFSGIVCMSFSKNMGLYGERVGCVQIVTQSSQDAKIVESVLASLQRAEISNPPAFGARIADAILSCADLRKQWESDLLEMSGRVKTMRKVLVENLKKEKARGSWTHILEQSGMFGFLGLSGKEVEKLKSVHHIYMAPSSRISIAGLNESNVEYVAKCIAAVTKQT